MKDFKETLVYQDRIVAFLDILGFKEIVLNHEKNISSVIEFIDKNLNEVLNGMKTDVGEWYSAKLFSDCICISCEQVESNLFNMLNQLSYFQLALAIQGIFIRGAITIGPHFENERIIFSEALIKAYELEQVANYPRIIISKSVLDLISKSAEAEKRSFTSFLIYSPDGMCFLDYFQHLYRTWEEHGIDVIDFLLDHKESISKQVEKNKTNSRVLDKYRWVAEYHNFKVPHFYNPDDYPNERDLIEALMIPLSIFPSYHK